MDPAVRPRGEPSRLLFIHGVPPALGVERFLREIQIAAQLRPLSVGWVLLLGLTTSARAQTATPGLDPDKPINQYIHDTANTIGLSDNFINALLVDRAPTADGFGDSMDDIPRSRGRVVVRDA